MTDTLTALQLVNEKFNQLEDKATTTYDTALAAINALKNLTSSLEIINEQMALDETNITINAITNTPPTVDTSKLEITMPSDPEAPVLVDDATILSDLPSYPSLNTSDVNPGDNTYTSALLTSLRTKLYDDLVSGSTGVTPAVEDAIFIREEERALQILEDGLDRKASLWAEIGWDLPDGNLGAMMQEDLLQYSQGRYTTSRDISIKSFELALNNAHFVVQQGVAYEAMIIQWTNWVAQRVYEASVSVINKELSKFKEDVNVVSSERTSIFEFAKNRMQYNIGKIQLYTSQIGAFTAKLQSEDVRVGAYAKAKVVESDVFKATSDWLIGKAGLDLKLLDTRLQQSLGNINILIKDKEIRLRNQEALNQLRVQALDALGRLTAQMMAGVWSSVSAGATATSHSQYSESHDYEEQEINVVPAGSEVTVTQG